MGKEVYSQIVLRQLNIHLQKNEPGSLPHLVTQTKIYSKFIKNLNLRAKYGKTVKRQGCKFLFSWIGQVFHIYDTKTTEVKSRYIGLHQN
jgi:hypothetical protein